MTAISFAMMESYKSYQVWWLGHHLVSTFAGTDPKQRASIPHLPRLCGPCIAAAAGHNVNWVYIINYNDKNYRKQRMKLKTTRNVVCAFVAVASSLNVCNLKCQPNCHIKVIDLENGFKVTKILSVLFIAQ